MNSFTIYPAIDIKNGKSVRISSGNISTEKQFGDPIEIANEFVANGATWIHLVDLDAAYGQGNNSEIINKLIDSVDALIQFSGGIQDEESLQRALDTKSERINLSTAALQNLNWTLNVIEKYGDRISMGLDIDGKKLTSRGRSGNYGELIETVKVLESAGCARFIVTEVSRDGSLSGPNFNLIEQITELTSIPLISSGGVSSLSDIKSLMSLKNGAVEGVIIGKAIYEGVFTLDEAIKSTAI